MDKSSFPQTLNIDISDSQGLEENAGILAEAMVNTVRESLLVLDESLRVRLANRSFFMGFQVTPKETLGRLVHELGEGQWNIPGLRHLLDEILSQNVSFRDFEVTHTFPHLGRRSMLLNAQKLRRPDGQGDLILLAIEDVTERKQMEEELRDSERQLSRLLKEKEVLIAEVHHRVKNNLQTVVSLLSLHAAATNDPGIIEELSEAEGRVRAIVRLHEGLYESAMGAELNFGKYLRHLAEDLKTLHGRAEVCLEVDSDDIVIRMETALPLGLIANELIVNSLKHAFPPGRAGHVKATFDYVRDSVSPGEPLDEALVRLCVEDDGVGLAPHIVVGEPKTLGLRIVQLLSEQLHGRVELRSLDGLKAWFTFLPDGVTRHGNASGSNR